MPTLRALLAAVLLASAGGAWAALQPPADAASPPVTAANWRRHPRIIAIRNLVKADQVAMATKRWRADPVRQCRSETRPYAAETRAIRDEQGRIRTYVTSDGSDDSAYRIEHHYDEAGHLRFAFARSSAVNGAFVEYRLFLDEWGKELWRDVRSRGSYTFQRPPAFPDEALVRDPATAAALPLRCGR